MLIVLSPAKTLDFESPAPPIAFTQPNFISESASLIAELRKRSPVEIAQMMSLSDKLVALNMTRYEAWTKKFTLKNSKHALLAFNGDVYEGLDASSLQVQDLEYAQQHLRILSGLYGILRPLDLMQAYRLEMGTSLITPRGKDLYAFWGDQITLQIGRELATHKNPVLLNLASDEYFKVISPKVLSQPIVSPVFQDEKDGKMKIISFYAKRARGLMTRFVLENQIDNPGELKAFRAEGYRYNAQVSTLERPVFQRKH